MSASDIDHIINHISLKKSRRRWRLIALGLLAVALLTLLAGVFGSGAPREDHIARLHVSGIITGDQTQLDLIRELSKDDAVKGMIVRINSPGGTTAGSEALYLELRKFAEKKPTVAVMDTVAASGGYITAIAADHIIARGNTITGSIGVIFSYPEISKLLDTLGVKMEELKSGELKAEPSPYKPASEKAKQVSMAMVEDGFVWFKGLVSDRRKITPERTAILADGRVYTGRQALQEALIDEIGGEDEAIKWLETEKNLAKDLPVFDRAKRKKFLDNVFGSSISTSLLKVLGLSRLAETAETSSMNGLLVLWHPQL